MSVLSRLKVPCFRAGGVPTISDQDYRLTVSGMVEKEAAYTLQDVMAWPKSSVDARLTSVSGFSVRARWEGVVWRDFLTIAGADKGATHVNFISIGGGYGTTLSLEDLNHPRVLLVYAVEGEPLEREYGGPLRMVIPHLWGYKSAKWLGIMEFGRNMRGGYWEERGYSQDGRIEAGRTFDLNTGQLRPIGDGEVTDF